MSTRLAALALLAVLWVASGARAQLHRATDPVATPASSVIGQDDALVIDVNPAELALLPSWSLAYLHAEVDTGATWLGRGDAVFLGTPLLWGFALGGSLQSVRPDFRQEAAFRAADRALGSFALAYAPNPRVGIGIATRTIASGDPVFDGLTAFDAGLVVRPSTWLGLSLVGRDLFTSRFGRGTPGLGLASSALLSTTLRPFGTPDLGFEFALAMDAGDAEHLGGRGGLTIEVPYLGAASGMVELEDLGDANRALRIVAELALRWGGTTVAGGATGGDGFDDDLGWYVMARAEGRERSGVPTRGRILELELSDASARTAVALAVWLERARIESRIAGVLLKLRTGEMPLAIAQELRLLIRSLREAGKPVVCHLEDASGSEYYACAGADRVLIDPAGNIRLLGTAATVVLFGETLRKVGVRADFVRIGAYKSAPEQLTQKEMSEAAREAATALLDDAHRRMLFDLARDLDVSEERVAALMDTGPQLAEDAVKEKMVDAAADGFDLRDDDMPEFEGRPRVGQLPTDMAGRWGGGPYVGVVVIDDEIVDGESVEVPFLDIHMSGAKTVIAAIDAMAREPRVRAIVVRVDSPGGSALASDQIWRALRRARARKPVIASLGSVAASGGYYVASAADEIWADPTTLTGSIGIFYGKIDVVGLAEKLGIGIEHFRRGKHAGADSLWRPFTAEERSGLAVLIRRYYRQFLERVAEGRGMTVEEVDRTGRGRVHSGDAALALKLVDHLGGLASALARARVLGELPADADVAVQPGRKNRLIDFVLSSRVGARAHEGVEADAPAIEIPKDLRPLVRMVMTAQQLGGGAPLARMPFQLDL
jgi:protease-4